MCGVVLARSLKNRSYFERVYGNPLYTLEKTLILMEKMHNRGQDGAGLVSIKIGGKPGTRYLERIVCPGSDGVFQLIHAINKSIREREGTITSPYEGDIYIGHLRYGTFGGYNEKFLHPVVHENNWRSRTIVIAGNFNLTNIDELFSLLVELGQHPQEISDTILILEKFVHFLNYFVEQHFRALKDMGYDNVAISEIMSNTMDIVPVLQKVVKDFDGGYVIAGATGNGISFVVRDPWGIRPAYYWKNDEVCVVASERPAILTSFNCRIEDIYEIPPGCALIINKKGDVEISRILDEKGRYSCSFERIYFARGTDPNIYNERKELGRQLAIRLIREVPLDIDNTVFSFVPNTSQVAFEGLMEVLRSHFPYHQVRGELVLVKDVKIRTFISDDNFRSKMSHHAYDVNYGIDLQGKGTLVIIDDSIVRGTTLKKSILRILEKVRPATVIVLSSAPQIRYPDFYGIDMSSLHELAAFNALIRLIKKK